MTKYFCDKCKKETDNGSKRCEIQRGYGPEKMCLSDVCDQCWAEFVALLKVWCDGWKKS